MLKIYDFEGFPNPARIRIALAEKGLSDNVSFVTVDVPGGEHRKAAFLAKNPYATVPVLMLEDGTCISECTAITEYLDHLNGSTRSPPIFTTPRQGSGPRSRPIRTGNGARKAWSGRSAAWVISTACSAIVPTLPASISRWQTSPPSPPLPSPISSRSSSRPG
jgi:glutaredoxin